MNPIDRSCLNKRRFNSEEEAMNAARKAPPGVKQKIQNVLRSALKLRAYLCPNCRHWHLTKKPERQESR